MPHESEVFNLVNGTLLEPVRRSRGPQGEDARRSLLRASRSGGTAER
jgi:hypothetical protein